MTENWSRTDVLFVAVVVVVFVFAVVVPVLRRTPDRAVAESSAVSRRWRRPPD